MASHFNGPILGKDNPEKGSSRAWYSKLPMGEDPNYFVYMNDFLVEQDYAAADWVITTVEAGAGSATEALAGDEKGGALLITNDSADNDSDSLQLTQETFSLTAGKRMWFDCRVKFGDVDDMDTFIGLAITDTTPLVATDRVGFQWTDADASIDVLTEKDSTETITDSGVDAVDATYVRLSMAHDGFGNVRFYIDGNHKVTHTTNVPDDENLCVTIHLQNGSAAANTATIDYIYVAQER